MEDFGLFLTWHSGNDTSPWEAAFLLLQRCPCAKLSGRLLLKLKSSWGIFKNITARKSSPMKMSLIFFFFKWKSFRGKSGKGSHIIPVWVKVIKSSLKNMKAHPKERSKPFRTRST